MERKQKEIRCLAYTEEKVFFTILEEDSYRLLFL